MEKRFEWDQLKATSNFEKHGIEFTEAILVWLDQNHTDDPDDRIDYGEIRRSATGLIQGDRFITVIYTERGGKIRIISARKASRNERRKYRHGQAQT